jgi:hypothetical protein
MFSKLKRERHSSCAAPNHWHCDDREKKKKKKHATPTAKRQRGQASHADERDGGMPTDWKATSSFTLKSCWQPPVLYQHSRKRKIRRDIESAGRKLFI